MVSVVPPSTYHASSCASWRKEGCPTPGPRTAHLQGAYSIRSFYPGLPTLKTIACPWAGVASMEASDLVPSRVEASSSLSIFSSCWTLSPNSHSCSQLYHLHHFKQPPSSHLYCRPWPQGTRTIFVFKLNAWYIFFTFNFYTFKSVD